MNYVALTFAVVFAALGTVFLRWPQSTDATMARNKQLASILFFVASAAFVIAFVISVLKDRG